MMVRRPAARVPSALGALALSVGIFLYAFASPPTAASSTETVQIRGHSQTLHTYGSRGGEPVIVSSGDGGWVHLGPHIAQMLAARGFFVVGFDVKTYLQGFTSTASRRCARRTFQPTTARCWNSPTGARPSNRY